MKKLRTLLQSRFFFKILTIIFLAYSISYTYLYQPTSKYSKKETQITGIITQLQIDGNQLTLYLKGKEKILVKYYFNTKEEKQFYETSLKLGDIIETTGTLQTPPNNTIPNGFNYKKYLLYHKIYYINNTTKITKKENNTSILYHLKNKIITRINKIDTTGYIKTFILGDKSNIDPTILQDYQKNGISHLFSISGMHVSLIVGILLLILNKISYNIHYKYSIISIFLLIYLFLTNFTASIIRTTIMYILSFINKSFNLKIKQLDIMLLTLIIAIIINPYIIYDIGFQFSYLISLILVIFNKKISSQKNYFKRSLYLSFICFLSSLPICIYHFYQVNILSIFLNILMIPLVSIFIFPLTLITFIFPILKPIYQTSILILETLNNIASNITILEIILAKPPIFIIILYYIIILSTLHTKKIYLLLVILLISHYSYPYLNNNFISTIIDVGQGDSILIKYPNNQGNILIDTGGIVTFHKENWQKRKKEYSLITSKTIPYLKSLGISSLDYLIITHGDYDHMGEAINLVENFKVEKVIFNCGSYNDLEKELIKVIEKKKIEHYSCIKKLNISNNKLYFLNAKEYDNENDNSNVIYTEFRNYKFLFMGDASTLTEKEILDKYNLPNIDVLKVGHHGSKTSSSEVFVDTINPKYGVISVGKNNRYGHPNKEVLDNLNNSKIYRTDIEGSIVFKVKKGKLDIGTCPP